MRTAITITAIVLVLMLAEVVGLYLMLHWPVFRLPGRRDDAQ